METHLDFQFRAWPWARLVAFGGSISVAVKWEVESQLSDPARQMGNGSRGIMGRWELCDVLPARPQETGVSRGAR